MFGAATTIPLTNAFRDSGLFYTVFAKWNLPGIWHSQDEAPTDRVGSLNRGAEWRIRMTVINLYQERRRLQLEGLANEDEVEVYFDLRFENTPYLSAAVSRTVLPPGEHAEVTLTFSPPAAEAYKAEMEFLVNGLWNVLVRVAGQGCELRLELSDPVAEQP